MILSTVLISEDLSEAQQSSGTAAGERGQPHDLKPAGPLWPGV